MIDLLGRRGRARTITTVSAQSSRLAFDAGSRADANLRVSASYDTLRDIGPIQEGTLLEIGFEVDSTGFVVRRYLPDQLGGPRLNNFPNGVGACIQLYLSNIVLPLLGVDYGCGINSGAGRLYVVVGIGT